MYRLRKRKARLLGLSNKVLNSYNFNASNSQKTFILAAGALNFLWHNWCMFWRSYWLTYLIGGYDLNNIRVRPVRSFGEESSALYYLLTLLGKRKIGSTGRVTRSYQEPTWGEISHIQNLATSLSPYGVDTMRIQGASTLYGLSIDHLQKVRNAQVHLTKDMPVILQSVVPYYLVNSAIKYPHEILVSREISSNDIALKKWVEDMNNYISFLV
jgi:hypothetical protein